jgi:hypothetical protein
MSVHGVHRGGANGETDELVRRKLEAFERIAADFSASFAFLWEVHGHTRLDPFPVASSVRYLHALWICECKDRLLDVQRSIVRYEGAHCLDLLRDWQVGETSEVVAFLQRKLDGQPFAELTRQIERAQASSEVTMVRRLLDGRRVLLNRTFNLACALDAIFALPSADLTRTVVEECAHLGHTPEDLRRQRAELETPLYAHLRHPALAQRNMRVMNALGMGAGDLPDAGSNLRTERAAPAGSPLAPPAETHIVPAITLVAMTRNNPAGLDLAMPPWRMDASIPPGEASDTHA